MHKVALQRLTTLANIIVATVVTVATEFTIQWNDIQGVEGIKSAGQAIPLVIGIGLVIRVLYISCWEDLDQEYREDQGSLASLTDFPSDFQPTL